LLVLDNSSHHASVCHSLIYALFCGDKHIKPPQNRAKPLSWKSKCTAFGNFPAI
jgi:hypothetical protein